MREKQIREGDFFKEKDQEEIIPGMPGYKFAEEEETSEIGEDDLPFWKRHINWTVGGKSD